jgi:hypothetical protein
MAEKKFPKTALPCELRRFRNDGKPKGGGPTRMGLNGLYFVIREVVLQQDSKTPYNGVFTIKKTTVFNFNRRVQ